MFRGRFWHNFDWILFGATLLLVVLGLIVLYAASFKASGLGSTSDVWHQLIFAAAGLTGLVTVARMDYRAWVKVTPWLYAATVAILIAVFILGKEILGATRWIDVGFFQFQPSEFAKLAMIVILAKFFAHNYDALEHPKYLLMSLAYLLIPMILVLRQPDLGTALVFFAIWLAMALVSRVRKLHLLALGMVGLALLPFAISTLKPFQRARLTNFVNPTADPLQSGYNAVQSTITVGSGQVFGRGLASGSQTQLGFLPSLAQHTDFIFAVLAEKLGFVGTILLLILFLTLLLRGLRIAYTAGDRFGMFMATGIVAMLVFHVFINIGMNMGIAPVTGIPLPFVSYGGTSLIVGMLSIGMLESIAIRRRKLQF